MFRFRMKELREKAGYSSQQSFANAFGVAQSTIGNWEAGKREPNFETAIRLAAFFGTSLDYLLGITEKDPSPTEGSSAVSITEEEQTILSAYRRADDHTRQMVDLALAPYTPPEQSKMAM